MEWLLEQPFIPKVGVTLLVGFRGVTKTISCAQDILTSHLVSNTVWTVVGGRESPKRKRPDPIEMGARVKKARVDLGLTQRELGRRVGVTEQAVQQWESGQTLALRYLAELAEALGRPEEWLRTGTTSKIQVKFTDEELDVAIEVMKMGLEEQIVRPSPGFISALRKLELEAEARRRRRRRSGRRPQSM